ncbi:retrovirus-related pol polyprotein from transposon TNT 1-94 [Tanacetum coccineum]
MSVCVAVDRWYSSSSSRSIDHYFYLSSTQVVFRCVVVILGVLHKTSPLVDDDLDEEEAIKATKKKNLENDIKDGTLEIDELVNIKKSRNHPLENVIEPNNVNEALKDESWIMAMQEELNQFVANDVWELVSQPKNMKIIGTKWVYRNKLDENGVVSRNKARLVAQNYNQQESIDYDETYAPVARLEYIRILLAYAYALDFKLFQMDIKSAFLNGFINEEGFKEDQKGINWVRWNPILRDRISKNVNEALKDESWIMAMQEELDQFIVNDVWELVPQLKNMTIIGTKWVYRNKLDKNDVVSRNKAWLVAQGYNQ